MLSVAGSERRAASTHQVLKFLVNSPLADGPVLCESTVRAAMQDNSLLLLDWGSVYQKCRMALADVHFGNTYELNSLWCIKHLHS
jgi:hypothetical protein